MRALQRITDYLKQSEIHFRSLRLNFAPFARKKLWLTKITRKISGEFKTTSSPHV